LIECNQSSNNWVNTPLKHPLKNSLDNTDLSFRKFKNMKIVQKSLI
jgi:hypothetical protein